MLPPEDFDKIKSHLIQNSKINPSDQDVISYALYPDVFEAYLKYVKENGDLSRMGSDIFFHGLYEGETCEVEIAEGKTLIVQLLEIGKLDSQGNRTLVFEVNGNRRDIKIKDKSSNSGAGSYEEETAMADPENKMEIGASIPGTILKVLVKEGDTVKEGDSLVVIEAMKMETNILASSSGTVESILVKEGQQTKTGQLLVKIK
jgi:pyruvate carboxylase